MPLLQRKIRTKKEPTPNSDKFRLRHWATDPIFMAFLTCHPPCGSALFLRIMKSITTSRLSRALAVLAAASLLPACSTAGVARKSTPTLVQAKTVPVVATAYGASAKCNSKWAGKNAIGGRLKSGEVTSAAADWSRFPVGTKFRVKETGRVYVVDDYGSAMVGKDKVDLFKTNYREVYRWGVRNVQLEIMEWGSFEKSLSILKPRSRSRHVKSMVQSLEAKLRSGETQRAG